MKKFRLLFLMLLCVSVALAQVKTRQLTGVVTDVNSNSPLVSATVKVKGKNSETFTNANGQFALNVPSDQSIILVVSYVGYTTQEINVSAAQNNVTIALNERTSENTEVVVTALGIKKQKRSVGYALGEVKGDELTKAREINLGNALSGRIAGVNVSSTATGPGGSSRVIIRGATSGSTNNQPLYVVDGIPIDNTQLGSADQWGGFDKGDGLSAINPDDIENISVLKGGAASALYGSRGANGVVLITTKSGKNSKGIGVEFNSSYTFEKILTLPKWQYQYGAGDYGAKPADLNAARQYAHRSWGAKLDGSQVMNPDGIMRPYIAQKNNLENFYNTGHTFSNTVAVTGGGAPMNFRFAVGNTDDNSIIPNSTYKRQNFSLALNAKPNTKIEFSSNSEFIIEKGLNRPSVSDVVNNVNVSVQTLATSIDVRTLAPGYDANGYEVPYFGDDVYVTNPYFNVAKVKNSDKKIRFISSSILKYNIYNGLYARAKLGIDNTNYESQYIEPTGIAYNPTGHMNESQTNFYEYNLEGILGYNKTFGNFSIDAFAGVNKQHNRNKGYSVSGDVFVVPFFYSVKNLQFSSFNNSFSEYEVNSAYASADLGYKNYLFVSLTGRNDWFSTLGKNNNNIFYPSVSSSFIFSDALKMPSWLSYGKLRASWANVGGGAPGPYSTVQTYSQVGTGYLGQPMMGTSSSVLANPALKPFNVRTFEIGTELGFLKDRLDVDITYYDKETTNDIVNASISGSTGYLFSLLNVGKIANKGVELAITGKIIASSNFKWETNYTFSYNKNTLIQLAEGLDTRLLGKNRENNAFVYLQKGLPFGIIKTYALQRDDKGQLVLNDDGTYRRGALVNAGSGVSPYAMGFNNSFSYKNFNLQFLLDGRFGGKMFSSTELESYWFGLNKNTLQGRDGPGFTVSGVKADGTPITKTVNAEDYWISLAFSDPERFVYDASFVKLRSLTLSYTIPVQRIKNTPVKGLTLSLVARNLALLYSKMPNVDPESNYNNTNAQGLERFGAPPTRSYGINLQVNF